MTDRHRPFESPKTVSDPPLEPKLGGEAERVRRYCFKYETSVKTIGWLYVFVGTGFSLAKIVLTEMAAAKAPGVNLDPWRIAWICGFAVLAYFHFWTGNGLKRLDSRARKVALVYGVISFAVAAVWFNLLVLLLQATALLHLFGVQARYVCTDEYHDIVRRTSHMKRATSWPKLILGLIVVLLIAILGGIVTVECLG